MIKGKVELIKDYGTPKEQVIYTDNNMIVDGAGEIISTMMTLPPDGDTISSASSIYDVSNFTIRAVSFGKAPLHYYYNAHQNSGPSKYAREASGQVWVSATAVSGASSYTPAYYLPNAPVPTDRYLVNFDGITLPQEVLDTIVETIIEYVNTSGFLLGWGENSIYPEYQIPASISTVSSISAGYQHFVALTASGDVSCWGGVNSFGQLNKPSLPKCKAVGATRSSSFAITEVGNLSSWGNNTGIRNYPETYSSAVSAITGGNTFFVVQKTDATVSAWGASSISYSQAPTAIQGIVKSVKSNWPSYHAVAILNDGTVSGWMVDNSFAPNNQGQVTFSPPPSGIIDVATGLYHTLLLTSAGVVSAYGRNVEGQCDVPSFVQGVTTKIAANEYQSFAVLNDGQIWGWGLLASNPGNLLAVPNDDTGGRKFYDLVINYKNAVGLYTSTVPYYYTETTSQQENDSFYNSENYKQNVNLIPFKDTIVNKINILGETIDVIPSTVGALLDGAYPPSGGITVRIVSGVEPYTTVVSASLSGVFNSIGSMDFRGYVNTTSGTNPSSGLVTSSVNVSTNGELIYIITMAGNDCAMANLYGGITQMGLWSYDLPTNLNSGFNPPYTFRRYPEETGTYIEPLKYKLFAKKVFNENIVKVRDNGSNAGLKYHQNLTIRWRLYFV
jgi:alpha-tubulin suppressor-like RCC1 family protein